MTDCITSLRFQSVRPIRRSHRDCEAQPFVERTGQRVEQHPHGRNLAALPGQITVDAVRDGGQNEDSRSKQFLLSMLAGKARAGENPDEQRNAGDPSKRDVVRKIHAVTEPEPLERLL